MEDPGFSFSDWFIQHWSRAGLPLAAVLLILSPLIWIGSGLGSFLVFIQLPVYMLHQYEEHGRGKFKVFANQMLAGGKEALTDQNIFWINILGVWAVDLLVLYLAVFVSLAFGLVAVYLAIVNGLLHVLVTVRVPAYNPGLWTSLALFLPLGGLSIYFVSVLGNAAPFHHLLAAAAALLLHLAVILPVRQRVVKLLAA